MTRAATSRRGPAVWRTVLLTSNLPNDVAPNEADTVSRWLILTRAAVAPMTVTAAAIAGFLAVGAPDVNWGWWTLAAIGILLAHAANNLMNDLADTQVGTDEADYPRAMYAPHPILSGMISKRGLVLTALAVNVADLVIMIVLAAARGWPIVAFAVGGFFLSYAYTAPPVRLKRIGLGELDVLIVWGPLMVGGCYYAATGTITWGVIAASIPYAVLCVTVLMGKHTDKLEWDARKGIHTVPVILGERRARAATYGLMIAFYAGVVACVIGGVLPWPTLVVAGAIPRLVKIREAFAQPRPEAPPPEHPELAILWPLWFAPFAFYHLRRVSWLFLGGLAVGALFDLYL